VRIALAPEERHDSKVLIKAGVLLPANQLVTRAVCCGVLALSLQAPVASVLLPATTGKISIVRIVYASYILGNSKIYV
jgi:hypothetical protein